jgi:uncharacterized phiE125 gp8 family phage protein
MTLTRIDPIDGEAILPLDGAKAAAHITHDDDDAVLMGFRDAALSHVERLSGFALAESDWVWTTPYFTARMELPVRPVVTLGDVTYYDENGDEQTYADARLIDGEVYPVAGESWPCPSGFVSIAFTAGPAPDDKLSALIAAAQIQFQIFENRGRDDQKFIEGMERAVRSVLGSIAAVIV